MNRLDGVTALVTRAAEDADGLAAQLRAHGARVLEAHGIRFGPPQDPEALDRAVRAAPGYDWVVFTSAHGVDSAFARASALDLHWPSALPVAAVGDGTRRRLATHGRVPRFVPAEFRTEELARSLPDVQGRRVLLLRARAGNPALPRILRERGAHVDDVEAYGTEPDPSLLAALAALERDSIDWLLFASPSTIEAFDSKAPASLRRRLLAEAKIACIGPVTAEAARRHGYQVSAEANPHTAEGLVAAILEAHALA
ncbi:MAG: uroporphyrinogen-III synthase [Thermoplasmatota archaeon]